MKRVAGEVEEKNGKLEPERKNRVYFSVVFGDDLVTEHYLASNADEFEILFQNNKDEEMHREVVDHWEESGTFEEILATVVYEDPIKGENLDR